MHSLDDLELGLQRLRLFNRDHAVFANLVHRFGDQLSDVAIVVGRNSGDVRQLFLALDLLRHALQFSDDLLGRQLNSALQRHRICARGHVLHAFTKDCLRENCRGGGAVAGFVVRFDGDFANHLRAHVFVLVLELDLFGDRDAVFGDHGRAKLLAQNNVATFWSQRHAHRIREHVHTLKHRIACFFSKLQFFCRHSCFLLNLICRLRRLRGFCLTSVVLVRLRVRL